MVQTIRRLTPFMLSTALVLGCSSKPTETAPFTGSSMLIYEVSEPDYTFDLRLSFSPQPSGFHITMEAPSGTRTIKVDALTAPLEGAATEAQQALATNGLAVDSLYLPKPSRRVGAIIPGGRVTDHTKFRKWTGYRVTSVMPPGFRFYEEETGVLVGWSFDIGPRSITAFLKEAR